MTINPKGKRAAELLRLQEMLMCEGARRDGGCFGTAGLSQFLFAFFFFLGVSELGKLEGESTWYLRDFLCFTNILSFLLKQNTRRSGRKARKGQAVRSFALA